MTESEDTWFHWILLKPLREILGFHFIDEIAEAQITFPERTDPQGYHAPVFMLFCTARCFLCFAKQRLNTHCHIYLISFHASWGFLSCSFISGSWEFSRKENEEMKEF